MDNSLTIFVPHCSGLLTDAQPHGDGLVAHGFISRLAQRGHRLYVAAEAIELSKPLPPNVTVFPIQRSGGARGRIGYMLKVRKLFRTLSKTVRFDLIHQLNPVYTGVSLALWDCEVPVVLGPYVADWPEDPDSLSASLKPARMLLKPLKEAIAHLQQQCASAILLTTEGARERVISEPVGRSKGHLLPHGIDTGYFSPGTDWGNRSLSRAAIKILFLANISERKGIFELLVAFDLLASAFPDLELWIAGGGAQIQAAKEQASSLKASTRIKFLGPQSRQDSLKLFRQADIYCLPSHGEPFGMTVLEAMSCGLPVVVTNAGGVRWLVDDEGGTRVSMKNPSALAEALAALIKDPNRRYRMGEHNRNRAVNSFDWNRVIDRLEQIYRMSLKPERGRAAQPEYAQPIMEGAAKRGERI